MILGGACVFENSRNSTCNGGSCSIINPQDTLRYGYCNGGGCSLNGRSHPDFHAYLSIWALNCKSVYLKTYVNKNGCGYTFFFKYISKVTNPTHWNQPFVPNITIINKSNQSFKDCKQTSTSWTSCNLEFPSLKNNNSQHSFLKSLMLKTISTAIYKFFICHITSTILNHRGIRFPQAVFAWIYEWAVPLSLQYWSHFNNFVGLFQALLFFFVISFSHLTLT